jgi:sugar fermentation stimulation protein A
VELTDMVKSGARAVMLFLAQREDSRSFTVAPDIDPAYAEGLGRARAGGVEVLCYSCRVGVEEIQVDRPLVLAL